ncbi:MAG TPA: methionyl-tRNA formyltransferase [Flavobacteriales bacterium]|mgnify:FL=1|nr:methionyl-tRNA formyltransferase [Flavobacteriales bacterium]HRE75884.1 methionyl-tRNA formyltransferase [Flavobacteriales bacterium]HRE97341.1 methionyl-tRNA formyltransferase [Flavobacteriales bacterium]HRJ34406.1 methionyl-tRNA formyltransferase [Flavobacteriales bacterium]HRJ39912.1 methionyl-tRNA formyltransferase [Flavobacteriales bacterium]
MKIVYMGTPEFAVAGLDALRKAGNEICAVVTATDKPAGRGQKLSPSAVKVYATENNIPVLQPEKLRDPEFLNTLKNYKADLFVVVAFRMLPDVVWKMPIKGTINLHASLLPNYRGAAPINWAVINGEKETGVSTFFIREEIDTGNVIAQRKVSIGENETAGELHDKLMLVGAELLVETVKAIESGTAHSIPQEEMSVGTKNFPVATKIFREDCKIDWTKKTDSIFNLIRGMSPYPAAFTTLVQSGKEETLVKIFASRKGNSTGKPGSIHTDGKTFLEVVTNDGSLLLTDIQQAGKKRMGIEEFLRGTKLSEDARML